MRHQWHHISSITMKSMLAPDNVMDSKEALGQATICLTQTKEEVEEMEMSGKHRGRGRKGSVGGGCYLGPHCVNSLTSQTQIPKGRKETITFLRHRFPTVVVG